MICLPYFYHETHPEIVPLGSHARKQTQEAKVKDDNQAMGTS